MFGMIKGHKGVLELSARKIADRLFDKVVGHPEILQVNSKGKVLANKAEDINGEMSLADVKPSHISPESNYLLSLP